MNTKQRIALLLADYAVRVIEARYFPKFTELAPIRSIETAKNTAKTVMLNSIRYRISYANHAAYGIYAIIDNYPEDAIGYIVEVAIHVTDDNITTYPIDMRMLINIAIDPDRYW